MARRSFRRVDKGVDRLGYWVGAYSILSGALTWLGKQLTFLEPYGWPEAIFLGLGVACILMLVLSIVLVSWRYFRPTVPNNISPSQSPRHDGPRLIFGSPRQMADEHGLSWWHVPIMLDAGGPSEIRNCIISMRTGSRLVHTQSVQMRWQSDQPNGETEIDLVAGRERFVPVALRHEPNEERPKSRAILTDLAFLRDNKETTTIDRVFTLIVSWGGGDTVSPHYYRLKVPSPKDSNGHFILGIVSESETAAIDALAGRRAVHPLVGLIR